MNQIINISNNQKVVRLRFSPNESSLFGACSDGTVAIWSVADIENQIKLINTFPSHLTLFYDLGLHPNGNFLVTAGEGPLSIWNLLDGTLYRNLPIVSDEVIQTVTFSPDGEFLLTASNYEILRVYSWKTGEIINEETVGERNSSITFHPDGKTFAVTCSWQGGSCVWFFRLSNVLDHLDDLTIECSYDTILPGTFNSNGLYFAFSDLTVNLYSFPECNILHSFDSSGHSILSSDLGLFYREFWSDLVFTPDNRLLICGSPKGEIFFWSLPNGELVKIFRGHEGAVWSLALNKRGSILASSGQDGTVRLWYLQNVYKELTSSS
jgi:WD40 repeat protein